MFIGTQDDLVQFAKQSCSVFWSGVVTEDTALPGAVKGKLGGPSQRRLSVSATTAVLQAVSAFYIFIMVYCFTFLQELHTKKLFIGGGTLVP